MPSSANHRAVLKIPVEKTVQRSVVVPVPPIACETPEQLAAWLQRELHFVPSAPPQIRVQPARTAAVAGSLVLLSITGLLFWIQLHTVRSVAVLTSAGAVFLAGVYLASLGAP